MTFISRFLAAALLTLASLASHAQAPQPPEVAAKAYLLMDVTAGQILAAKDSNFDCVSCHSKEARLLDRLYQYRSETELARRGWLSQAVFNEAYVVGMSRSPLLDALGLGVIGLTLLGLIAHGWGRYRAYRRLREDRP